MEPQIGQVVRVQTSEHFEDAIIRDIDGDNIYVELEDARRLRVVDSHQIRIPR